MLRRRLFTIIGALILAMLLTAIAAAILLQLTASKLGEVGDHWKAVSQRHIEVTQLMDRISEEAVLDGADPAALLTSLDQLGEVLAPVANEGQPEAAIVLILLDQFGAAVATGSESSENLSRLAVSLHDALARLDRAEQSHLRDGQLAATRRLRLILLGLTLAFIVLINLAVVVILRTSRLVVEPVESLVRASRLVAKGQYDTRVEIRSDNEFGELGRAFNEMTAGLEERQAKRIETMKQAAAAVSHELNNAIAGLDLQLELIKRAAAQNKPFDESIQRVREAVQRIARTTDSLRRVRRIVLTDYAGGETMLDLARSCEETDTGQPAGSDRPAPSAKD